MFAILIALLMQTADPAHAAVPPAAAAATSDTPVPASEDSPEEIAKDSARDLKDSRYYNKPGATRADYDKDWQECRLIARGSVTPGGMPVVVYNPAIISPAAAAGGGLLGGLIAGAIAEGETRRGNRRNCLLYRGWRLIEVTDEQEKAFLTMGDTDREAWFNRMVGAENPESKAITRWTNEFAVAPPLAPATAAKN
jgi:hypothetical protein